MAKGQKKALAVKPGSEVGETELQREVGALLRANGLSSDVIYRVCRSMAAR
jgi:hypothetical protein